MEFSHPHKGTPTINSFSFLTHTKTKSGRKTTTTRTDEAKTLCHKKTSTINHMEEHTAGPLVPAVKTEPSKQFAADTDATVSGEIFPATMSDPDKDFLCPICMQIIKDAFLTACGHSFCYMCIITHLRNKSDCPCCGHYLTNSNLFPNFLLDKVRNSSPILFRCDLAMLELLLELNLVFVFRIVISRF